MDSESLHTRVFRTVMNWFPAYRGTGGRVTYITADWHEARIRLPLSWRTRNYFGTVFGGSIYACVDPLYALLLVHALGPQYTVWDRAATIDFRSPGRTDLTATLRLPDDEVATIRETLAPGESCDRHYTVDLVDAEDTVCATVEKTVYVRRNGGRPGLADYLRHYLL